jgi:UrcA family protein
VLTPIQHFEETTMNKSIHLTLYTALCCAMGTTALRGLAMAGAAEEDVPTQIVRFGDLDIAKPAGAKVLYHRIQAAAFEVCRRPSSREFQLMAKDYACIEQAIDNAVRNIDSAPLTELRFGSEFRLASK